MYLQGTVEGSLHILYAQIHFGQKDGKDFAQISFPTLGDMNNEVKSVIIGERTIDIVFDINGFDMKIHLENKENEWTGKVDLDIANIHADLELDYISDAPDFNEHHYIMNEENVKLLKENHTYDSYETDNIFTYELNNEDVLRYVKAIGIDVENNHDFDTVCKLMKKTCEIIHHDGVNYCHDRENRGTIAQIEFANKQNGYTNCRGLAIIMHGILRAYGFRANLIECWPVQSDAPSDIHVVCEVFVDEFNKMVLIDPSNNLIYYKHGVPVNLYELRSIIVNDEIDSLTKNEDATHNGEEIDLIQMLSYMSKNLVFLNKSINSNETLELHEANSICLAPKTLINQTYPEASVYTSNITEFYL